MKDFFSNDEKYPDNSWKKKATDCKVTMFVALDLRPAGTVEGAGFRALLHEVDPQYEPPS